MRNFESGFNVYIKLAKKLAFRLPNAKDRVKACKWIKKIVSVKHEDAKKIQNHALQLLLLCLQRKVFVGPFKQFPEKGKPFSSYDWSYQPADIARDILQAEYEEKGQPPITYQLSGDLCEYVAYQDIPQFGAHFYYACSPEELSKWNNIKEEIIPKNLLVTTAVASPETSVLARTVAEDTESKKRSTLLHQPTQFSKSEEFADATIIDDQGKIKESFLKEQGEVSDEIARNRLLEDAVAAGIIEKADLRLGEDIELDNGKIGTPYIESVVIIKDGRKVSEKSSVKNVSEKERKKLEDFRRSVGITDEEAKEHVQIQGEEIKEDMFQKMPARLRERLAKKFVPKELQKYPGRDPNVARTPEIFRKGARGPFRKYKPQEFLLPKDEPFRSAAEVFKGLEYIPPSPTTRRSPIRKGLQKITSSKKSEVRKTKKSEVIETPSTLKDKDVEMSFERSMAEIKERRKEPEELSQKPKDLSSRRKHLLERLRRVRESQPKKLVFEEDDIDIEPGDVQFERFIYQELPEEEEVSKEVTILRDEDMPIEDVFGDDQISTPRRPLPTPGSMDELRTPGILLETEMPTEDMFSEDQVDDPKVVFKEVRVEDEYKIGDESAKITKGARLLQMPDREPMIQRFLEEKTDRKTPELEKQLENKAGDALDTDWAPMKYDSDFLDRSILRDEEMQFSDIFGETQVEPPIIPRESSPVSHFHGEIYPYEMIDEESFPRSPALRHVSSLREDAQLPEEVYKPRRDQQMSQIQTEYLDEIPFRRVFPDFQDYYPRERVDDQYFPEFGAEGMLPGEELADVSLQEMEYRKPEETTDKLARLKTQLTALKGLPMRTPDEKISSLQQGDLLDPIEFNLYPEGFRRGLLDESLPSHLQSPLIQPPKQPDYFASFERKFEETVTEAGKDSILAPEEMDELFDESSVAQYVPPWRFSPPPHRSPPSRKEILRMGRETSDESIKSSPIATAKSVFTRKVEQISSPAQGSIPKRFGGIEAFPGMPTDRVVPSKELERVSFPHFTEPSSFYEAASILAEEDMSDMFTPQQIAHPSLLQGFRTSPPMASTRKVIPLEDIERVSFPQYTEPSSFYEAPSILSEEDMTDLFTPRQIARPSQLPRLRTTPVPLPTDRLMALGDLGRVSFPQFTEPSSFYEAPSILDEEDMSDMFTPQRIAHPSVLQRVRTSPAMASTRKVIPWEYIERVSFPQYTEPSSFYEAPSILAEQDMSDLFTPRKIAHPSQLPRPRTTPVPLPIDRMMALEDLERVSFPQFTEPSSFYETPSILAEDDMSDMFTPQRIAHHSSLQGYRTSPAMASTRKVIPLEDIERVSFPQYTEPSSFYEAPSILSEEDMTDRFTPRQIAHPSQLPRLRTTPVPLPTDRLMALGDLGRVSFPQLTEPSSFYEAPSILAEEDMSDMFTPRQIAHPTQLPRLRTTPVPLPIDRMMALEDLERVSFPQFTEPRSFYETPSILAEDDMSDMFTPQQIAHPSVLQRLRTSPAVTSSRKVIPWEDIERVSFPQYTERSSFYEAPSILAEQDMSDLFTPRKIAHPSQLPRPRITPVPLPIDRMMALEDLERVSFPQFTEPSSFYEAPSILDEEDMSDMFTPQRIAHPSVLQRVRTSPAMASTRKVIPWEYIERVSFPQYTEPSSFYEAPSILAEQDMSDLFTPRKIAHPSQLPRPRTTPVPLPIDRMMALEDLERVSFPQFTEPSSFYEAPSILGEDDMSDIFTPQRIAHPSVLQRLRTSPAVASTRKLVPMEDIERVSFPQYTEPSSFYEAPSILAEEDMSDMFTPRKIAHPSQLPRPHTTPVPLPSDRMTALEDLERVSFPQFTEPSSFYEAPSILGEEDMSDMFTPQRIAHPSVLQRLRTSPAVASTRKLVPMEDIERVSFPQFTEPSSFYEAPSILAEQDMSDLFTPRKIAHPSQLPRPRTTPVPLPIDRMMALEDLERVSFPQFTEPSSFYEAASILGEEDMSDMFTPQRIAHPSVLQRLRASPAVASTRKLVPMEDIERVSFPQYTEPSSFYEAPSILAEEDMSDMFTPRKIAHPSQLPRPHTTPVPLPSDRMTALQDLERVSFPQFTEPSSFYEAPSILGEEDMSDMFTPQRIAHPSVLRRLRTSPAVASTRKLVPMEDIERVSFPQYTEPSSFYEAPSILAEQDMSDLFTPRKIAHPSQLPRPRTTPVPLPIDRMMALEDLERVSFPQFTEPSSFYEAPSILGEDDMSDMFTPQRIAHPSVLQRLHTSPAVASTRKLVPMEDIERVSFPQYTEPSSFYEAPSILAEEDMSDMFTPQKIAHPSQLPRPHTTPVPLPSDRMTALEDLERVSFPQFTEPSSFYEAPSILDEEDMSDMFTTPRIPHSSVLRRLRTSPAVASTRKLVPMEDIERVSFPQYTEPSSFYEAPSILAEQDMSDLFTPRKIAHPSQLPRPRTTPVPLPIDRMMTLEDLERVSFPQFTEPSSFYEAPSILGEEDMSDMFTPQRIAHPSVLQRLRTSPAVASTRKLVPMEDIERVSFPQYTEPSSFYEAPSIVAEQDMSDLFTPRKIAHTSQLPRPRTTPVPLPIDRMMALEDLERVSFPQFTEPSSFYEAPSILGEEDMSDMFTPQRIAHPSVLQKLRTSPAVASTRKLVPMEDIERVSFPQYTEPSSFYEAPSILAEEDMTDLFTPRQIAYPSQFPRPRTTPVPLPTDRMMALEDLERVSFPQFTEPSSFYEAPSILAEKDMSDMFTPRQIAHPSELPRLRKTSVSLPADRVLPSEDLERFPVPLYTEPSSVYAAPSILAEEDMNDTFTPQRTVRPSQLPKLRTTPVSLSTEHRMALEDLERVTSPISYTAREIQALDEIFDASLGQLSRALYIAHEEEEAGFERYRLAHTEESPFFIPTPPKRPPFLPDASPIGRTDVLPHEKGFKWLDNYMPFEEQVRPKGKLRQTHPVTTQRVDRPFKRKDSMQDHRLQKAPKPTKSRVRVTRADENATPVTTRSERDIIKTPLSKVTKLRPKLSHRLAPKELTHTAQAEATNRKPFIKRGSISHHVSANRPGQTRITKVKSSVEAAGMPAGKYTKEDISIKRKEGQVSRTRSAVSVRRGMR